MSDDLVERLRQSWDTDRSIMSQTSRWMTERKEAADRIEELEAKLAKAVEALKHIEHCDIHAPTHARNILKELTGGKNE